MFNHEDRNLYLEQRSLERFRYYFFKPPRKGIIYADWLNISKERYEKRIIISPEISNDLNAEEPSLF